MRNRPKSAVGAEGLTFHSHCVTAAGLTEAHIAADLRVPEGIADGSAGRS
jgi:hypothetical protein